MLTENQRTYKILPLKTKQKVHCQCFRTKGYLMLSSFYAQWCPGVPPPWWESHPLPPFGRTIFLLPALYTLGVKHSCIKGFIGRENYRWRLKKSFCMGRTMVRCSDLIEMKKQILKCPHGTCAFYLAFNIFSLVLDQLYQFRSYSHLPSVSATMIMAIW